MAQINFVLSKRQTFLLVFLGIWIETGLLQRKNPRRKKQLRMKRWKRAKKIGKDAAQKKKDQGMERCTFLLSETEQKGVSHVPTLFNDDLK
eukprot:3988959-Ditylum_brightwellii.AAC.1